MNNEWNSEVVTDVSESDITVDQAYNATSENPQSGTAVAQAVEQAGGTVDQSYNASSANAQSGTAVAQAIAGITPGTTYRAGDGIKILSGNSPAIAVDYDSDTIKLIAPSFTENVYSITKAGTSGQYTSFPLSSQARYFMGSVAGSIQFKLPPYAFYYEGQLTGDIVMVFSNGVTLSSASCYLGKKLDTVYDSTTGRTYITGMDRVTITTPTGSTWHDPNWSYTPFLFTNVNAVGFGEYDASRSSVDRDKLFTCAGTTLDSPIEIVATATNNKARFTVRNPLPAFSSSDAGKVLQVQSDGSIAWVTLS